MRVICRDSLDLDRVQVDAYWLYFTLHFWWSSVQVDFLWACRRASKPHADCAVFVRWAAWVQQVRWEWVIHIDNSAVSWDTQRQKNLPTLLLQKSVCVAKCRSAIGTFFSLKYLAWFMMHRCFDPVNKLRWRVKMSFSCRGYVVFENFGIGLTLYHLSRNLNFLKPAL